MTSFSVVTVLHDSEQHLVRLLDSLERHVPGEAQVIVVDTGSTDGGPQVAADRGHQVVELPGNPGFGGANNAGVQQAGHDVTVLLNPDIELLDDGIVRLVEDARSADALMFPRLLNPDGSIQDSAHPVPGTIREVVRALTPRLGEPWRAPEPTCVGWAIAAAIAAKTRLLRSLGPFDPEGFLFYEDMELCLRAGVPSCLVPDVVLTHAGGHSTHALDRLSDEARRRREVVLKTRGRRAQQLDDLAQAITFARAVAFRRRAREQLRALRAARRG